MSNEFIVKFSPCDKVETNWTCSFCFEFVERNEISFNTVAETGNIVAKKGNNVEATFDFVACDTNIIAIEAGVDGV